MMKPYYQDGGIIDWFMSLFSDDEPKPAVPKTFRFPSKYKITDMRKLSGTTGRAIDPRSELLSGEYDGERMENIVRAAKRYGIDPYTALAIDLQETGLGKRSPGAIGHSLLDFKDLIPTKMASEEESDDYDMYARSIATKMQYADKLGIKDPLVRLQTYNGLGKIYPETEQNYHGFKMKKIYGVPVPKGGIDMRKNPLYGKRVSDITENILKKDKNLATYINNIKKKGGVVVSPYGQWAYPGMDTIVPTPTGKITMRNVSYPVYGEDETGYAQMMYPGGEYQFPGQMVYETPMMEEGGPTPYFKTEKERQEYRNRLREESKKALEKISDDSQYLISTPYNPINNDNNCINGVCGLNIAAGLKYSNPSDADRYISNLRFAKNVRKGKEDYYRADGNFDIGDHVQYVTKKGTPKHSKIIYDITTNDDGSKTYHMIHNAGGTEFRSNSYSEKEMNDMISGNMNDVYYDRVHVYRPGYNLDKDKLSDQRRGKTPPEARKAMRDRSASMVFETANDPNYTYSIREDSPYFNDQPEGMQEFVKFANDREKINALVSNLDKVGLPSRANKNSIHNSLLNVFGILGQENKWDDRIIGGTGGVENLVEKVFKPKNWSIGPGQIKFNEIDPKIRKEFGIQKPKDLYDWNKLLPLMVAIDSSNRTWMERQGDKFSQRVVGVPGLDANSMKWSEARMSPYFWQGPGISNLRKFLGDEYDDQYGSFRMGKKDKQRMKESYIKNNIRNIQKVFDEGSYGQRVFDNIDQNLQRTSPLIGELRDLPEIVVRPKSQYQKGGQTLPAITIKKEPIYVDNPNDPKLRAYQDSLYNYNSSNDFRKLTKLFGKIPFEELMEKKEILRKKYNKGVAGGMEPVRYEKDPNGPMMPIYKKPVQLVKYKKPTVDTVYVGNPNDQRLRAYQDSLRLFNTEAAYRKQFRKSYTPAQKKAFYKAQEANYNFGDIGKSNRILPVSNLLSVDFIAPDGSPDYINIYKKPVQPVIYRKPEPVPAPVAMSADVQQTPIPRANYFQGTPVYAPTPYHGSGAGSFVGYKTAQGDTVYVKPEDYERMGVPAYGKQYIESKTKPKMQIGGTQYIDSVLNANRNLNWVKRLYNKNTPSIQIPGEPYPSTHFTEYGDGRVYPTVVQMPNGKLQYLGNRARDYANSTKTYIQFPSDKEAKWFSENYKKGTGVLKSFKSGGQHGGLDRWFAEKWVDVKTGKDCGRQEGEKRKGYPACRPSRRVSSQTPKTASELSSAEREKFKRSKTSSERINYNHKRN